MDLKLPQLKAQAFRISGVSTTKALKKLHGSIAVLDMRLKASWKRVIEILENLSSGIPVWNNAAETLDDAIANLLDYQDTLVAEMASIGLNAIAANQEFEL